MAVKRPSAPPFCHGVILLTCTVHTGANISHLKQRQADQRLALYKASIGRWLTETPYHIVAVDNSGYTEPLHDLPAQQARYEQLGFVDGQDLVSEDVGPFAVSQVVSDPSKGNHELAAIRYALRNSVFIRRAAKADTWIIKVTGRFFIPEFHMYLQSLAAPRYLAVRQSNPKMCQMVGARKHVAAKFLFRPVHKRDVMIEDYYEARLKEAWAHGKVLAMPPLPIPPTRGGGDGRVFTYL